MDLKRIQSIVANELEHKRSHPWKERGNKYTHGQRVAVLALKLRHLIYPDNDTCDSVITVASWYHDIQNGQQDHCAQGAQYTHMLLKDVIDPELLEQITQIIRVHDDRDCDRSIFSWATKLVQDADLLDHFGTNDIMIDILTASQENHNVNELSTYMNSCVDNKVTRYLPQFNYEVSRNIFLEKMAYYQAFAQRFAAEARGEIFLESSNRNA